MFKISRFYVILLFVSIESMAQSGTDSIPSIFKKRYLHKDISLMQNREKAIGNPFALSYEIKTQEGIGLSGLNRSGSISRAITLGNNQDLSLNSSLNLQLNGRISDDLELIAVISDDNIPIQPEGNTQQIQDFDRVYIQLLHKNYSLTAGDFELRKPNSYFLNYFKKAKGAYVQTNFETTKSYTIKNDLAAAIAKGKYNRQLILGREGIQGPYRLQGIANENFIIVLAGTERVFIDGILMKRGENLDYTIDYNTAEITFMPRRVITAYSRITVEFEYSDKNYSRSLTTLSSSFENKKNAFRINYYNEQDSKNRPLLQDLNDDQKRFLSSIGDATSSAYFPSIDSVGFSDTEIRYKKTDSNGIAIFVYSTNPEDAIYKLNFSQVGTNLGNYILENSLANGRVFKWVAPIGGIPQGNFEPVVVLVAPRKTSMFTFAAEHKSGKKWSMGTELAISQTDLNLFSSLDDADNTGIANKSYIEYKEKLKSDSTGDLLLVSNVQAELLDKNYRFVEFYRPVEFNRDFNLNSTVRTAEQWYSFQTALVKNSKSLLYYRTSYFLKDTIYRGMQHGLGTDLNYKKFRFFSNASLLITELNNKKNSSNFLRHLIDLSRETKFSVIGIGEETEKNLYKNNSNDTLGNGSFAFYIYKAYLKSPENWINKYLLEYSNRFDESPFQNELRAATRTENVLLNTELNKNSNALFGFSVNYRNLNVIKNNSNLKSEENIISRIRFDGTAWKGLLSSNTFYEIGTGQEPKRAFTYLQVPAGQGVYVYRDYNNNGVKELNEFEIAKYSYEADYIRVSIVNTDFVRTKSTSLSENILIDPARKWSNETGYLKFLSLFSNQLNFKIERKTLTNSSENIFNPFDLSIADSSLIGINTQYRESFYFKRSDPIFGADYTFQGNSTKNLLSIGFDSRSYNEHLIRTRWNILNKYSVLTEIKRGKKDAISEAAAERNFTINYVSLKPEFGLQYSAELRWNVSYLFLKQENIIGAKEESSQHKLSAELKYNAGGKSSIQTQVNFIYNDFIGNSNSAIAYELLEGLQAGRNLTWSANWQKNIGSSLQISILYDGRSSAGAKAIHAGSMQARAFF
jgi:hypothetical protein